MFFSGFDISPVLTNAASQPVNAKIRMKIEVEKDEKLVTLLLVVT